MTITGSRILWQLTLETDRGGARYKVPDGQQTWATSIRVVNTDGSPVTFNVYVTKAGGGESVVYSDPDTPLPAKRGVQVLDDPQELRLGPGDYIEADASKAGVVKLTLSGVELV